MGHPPSKVIHGQMSTSLDDNFTAPFRIIELKAPTEVKMADAGI
jgi:hypothetical protein